MPGPKAAGGAAGGGPAAAMWELAEGGHGPVGYTVRPTVVDAANVLHTMPRGRDADKFAALQAAVARLEAWESPVTLVIFAHEAQRGARASAATAAFFDALREKGRLVRIPSGGGGAVNPSPGPSPTAVPSPGPLSPTTASPPPPSPGLPADPWLALQQIYGLTTVPKDIPRDVAADIVAFFGATSARRATGAGRKILPLDDLVVVYTALRNDGAIWTNDRYTDLRKFAPTILSVLRRKILVHLSPDRRVISVSAGDGVKANSLHDVPLFARRVLVREESPAPPASGASNVEAGHDDSED